MEGRGVSGARLERKNGWFLGREQGEGQVDGRSVPRP